LLPDLIRPLDYRATPTSAQVTVAVLLYNAAADVVELVEMVLAQRHAEHGERSDWLQVIFVDDCSKDATLQVLHRALEEKGRPPHIRVMENASNLGLAATLNRVMRACSTQYVVTCQCDCRFGSPAYVADMLALFEKHPDAAAITGQPILNQPASLQEKIYLVENIQDILPRKERASVEEQPELIYAGFAEGRADGFRLEVVQAAGYYDTTLRVSGEDQVLSGRFRELGYNVYQATRLTYVLSLSSEQDTLQGLLRKQYTYGKTHPYILMRAHETLSGVIGKRAGSNRRHRVVLRTSQVLSSAGYIALLGLFLSFHAALGVGVLLSLLVAKGLIFRQHLTRVPMSFKEFGLFFALQPAFDVYYTIGVLRGLIGLASRTPGASI